MASVGIAATAVIALAGLLAYVPGMRALGSLRLDYIPMAPSTAGCFLLLSVALFGQDRKRWLSGRTAVAVLIAVFGLLELIGSLAGLDITGEDRLTGGVGTLGGIPVGRMSPATALVFVMAATATLLLCLRWWGAGWAASLGHAASSLGLVTVLLSGTVLLGYLFGTPFMYTGGTVPMAATTAIAFFGLGTALVATAGPARLPIRLVVGDSLSARLSRAFLALSASSLLAQGILGAWLSDVYGRHALLTSALIMVTCTLTAFVIARVSRGFGARLEESTRKLLTSEERHRTILHTAMDGFWYADMEGRLLEVNPTYSRMSGYRVEELLAMGIADVEAGETAEDSAAHMQRVKAQGEGRFESRYRRKDGSTFEVEVSVQWRPEDGGRFVAFVRDITARKRAEEAQRQNEARFRSWFELPIVGIALTSPTKGWLEVNDHLCVMLGYEREELAGMGWADLTHPEDLAADNLQFERVLRGEIEGYALEKRFIRRDGSTLPADLSVRCVRTSDGTVDYFVALLRDITARKQAEEARALLEQQLLHAQKLESVGRLAGGVAHDFNNMLGVILGNVEFALQQADAEQPIYADLVEIQNAARRSADLTRQLLTYARKQTVAPEVLDVNETLQALLAMLQRLLGEDVRLAWEPGTRVWPITMDPSQLANVLTNLCLNARDSIADVGTIALGTANCALDADWCAAHSDAVPGDYVRLTVRDTGSGMDEATVAQIFEPFFTTKGVGEGTGLGLATVYGAVRQNHGFVTVSSALGQGTTFDIYLPRQESQAKAPGPAEPVAVVRHAQQTILLVEDEPAILRLTTRVLQSQGYAVLAASSPSEAIRLSREHSGPIHLLLSDVVMPEMNGRDLATSMASLRPQLKHLFMSGHAADVIASRGLLEQGVAFIEKPYPIAALTAKVHEVLKDLHSQASEVN